MKKTAKVLSLLLVLVLGLTGCVAPKVPNVDVVVDNPPVVEEVIEEVIIEIEEEDIVLSNLHEVHNGVKEGLGFDYYPEVPVDIEYFLGMLNLDRVQVEDFIYEIPMISMVADEYISIKATEGNADLVEELLISYRNKKVEDSFQYPMNMAKVSASEVLRYDNDIYFIILGAHDERGEATEEEALEFAKSEVEKVKLIISGYYK